MEGLSTHNTIEIDMDESLVKYLAGLLDADGSLSFNFKQDQNRKGLCFLGLTLSLASSDAVDSHGYIETLPDITGMGTVSRYGNKKQYKSWSISKRRDLEMLLPRLIKHMLIKAKHWQWLLDIWRFQRTQSKTVTVDEMELLKISSKESRKTQVGPIKPKNHPTWAWLAGYLDGDGYYSYNRYTRNGSTTFAMRVGAVAHERDSSVLRFIHKAFGGSIKPHGQSEHVFVWYRSLGYQNKTFALGFLGKLARHSKLKRDKIDSMIHHHQQRLSVPGTNKTYCKMCDRPCHGRGYCQRHYQIEYRAGNLV